MATKDQKSKFAAINKVGTAMDKKFEQTGTFQSLGKKVGKQIPSIPTGFPTVDKYLLGCGGLPRGRVIEIFGEESSGKTAFACHVIGQCQKAGGVAVFVDAEHALDPTFAAKLGVNMDQLMITQPDYGEMALDIVQALVESSAADLIVIDSVSALVPKAELDGEMGQSHMGLQARLMSQAMRKLVGIVSKKNCTVLFINQIREKVGLVFGDPTVTSGGKALKFAASIRLEVRRIAISKGGVIKEGDAIVGHRMNIKAKKNKAGAPFRETQITLNYQTGWDMRDDVIQHALDLGLVTGSAKYTFKTDKLGEKFFRHDLDESRVREEIDNYYKEQAVTPSLADIMEEQDEEANS